jgi:hypothetical protein
MENQFELEGKAVKKKPAISDVLKPKRLGVFLSHCIGLRIIFKVSLIIITLVLHFCLMKSLVTFPSPYPTLIKLIIQKLSGNGYETLSFSFIANIKKENSDKYIIHLVDIYFETNFFLGYALGSLRQGQSCNRRVIRGKPHSGFRNTVLYYQ